MTLDRAIAIIFLVICLVYGYTAFVIIEEGLLPFELNMTVLPNTLPKVLSIIGIIIALTVIFTTGKAHSDDSSNEIDYRRILDYQLGQAVMLIILMIAYAFCLRPLGFIGSTTAFLVLSSILLGERKYHILIPIAAISTGGIWYLVQNVLGIFMRPWPAFIG
ncbi:MAG: tripartite tricarboxylate transporter TctB family protein [Arenicellales bacterium]|jgi:putative tricarboxylic transport membrane protein|nr:hypothetical protein [Acidiferrobacteraceae bacterium]MDP6122469.1 tripartite tricarboxylate transporter TctB family protein [Arenicellales bacterium]|tara:strand:- start:1759 stop:2244 length:486 start_codon:yes stop_codon:yes gene_type:complete